MSTGQTIAHYRIVAKIGEGGMGEVYRATDTKLAREVAIKVLPESVARDADRLARFQREAQVLAALNHPNIAAIYGVEDRALVMELVEGQTLADRIARGPIPIEDAMPVIEQLIEALEYAHEKGIVHRDLKPANIKITPEGRVKVLDFGLAKALTVETATVASAASSPTLTMQGTMAGVIMGTAAYMAPEQARGQKVDKRADIWAFGVVVHEMLTGQQLFGGETVSDTIAHVLTRDLNVNAAPPRVRLLLSRCLQRDPKKRLRDIGDAIFSLEEPPSSAPPARKPHSWVWLVAAACAVTTVVFASLWLRRAPVQPPLYRMSLEQSTGLFLSPNGRLILDNSSGEMKVRPLDGVSWRILPGTEGAADTFWSPDSSTIGYFSEGRLRVISVEGSNARNLAAAPDSHGGTWRGGVNDGTILFATGATLKAFDLAAGNSRELPLRFTQSQTPHYPLFLPEGDGFIYVSPDGKKTSFYRSSLSASGSVAERIPIATQVEGRIQLARHPLSGQWFLFACVGAGGGCPLEATPIHPRTGLPAGKPVRLIAWVSRNAVTGHANFDLSSQGLILWRNASASMPIWRLHWFDRNGNVVGTVGDANVYLSLALSPDETRLAVLQGFPISHVWRYDLKSGKGRRVASLSGVDGNPLWSPDGHTIYYSTRTETGYRVVRQADEEGSQPETLYQSEGVGMISPQDLSPDGRHMIALIGAPSPEQGIYQLDLTVPAGSGKFELVARNPGGSHARISPDGRWLLFNIDRGMYARRYPLSDDTPRLLSSDGFRFPFFSRDGRVLYSRGGSPPLLAAQAVLDGPSGIRLGDRSILFPLVSSAIFVANLAAASRDGNRILAISTDVPEEAKTQLLTDWTALLPPAER